MLKQVNRLKKRQDFKRVYQRGKSNKNWAFVLYYRPNNLGEARLGFSVSKKIGNAICRNKMKRRLREACRLEMSAFTKGYDYVFIARNGIKNETVQSLQKKVNKMATGFNLKPRYAQIKEKSNIDKTNS